MSIANEIETLAQNVSDLQDAIVAKGGTVTGNGLATLVQDVEEIPSGGASPDLIINGGTTPPTDTTPGSLGALYNYVDTTNEQNVPHVMVCLYADPSIPLYRWVEQNSTLVTERNNDPMWASAGQLWLDQSTGNIHICTKGATETTACTWESLAKYVNSSKAQISGRFYSEYELTWSFSSKSGSVSSVTVDNEKFNEYVEANKDKQWEYDGVYIYYYTSDQKCYFGWDNFYKEHGLTLAEMEEIGITISLSTEANGSFKLGLSIAVSGDFPTVEVFEGLTADDFITSDRPRLFSKAKANYMDEDTGDEGEDYIFLHSVGELQCMEGDIPDNFLRNNQSNKSVDVMIQYCSKIGHNFASDCASEGIRVSVVGEDGDLEIGSNFCSGCSVDMVSFDNYENIRVGGHFLSNASCTFGDGGYKFDKFVSVGDFFCGNTTFSQRITSLGFGSLETIGDRFFIGSNFNFPISLPLVNKIGDGFLHGCTSFNQPLTLCARKIGSSFLNGCSSFNSPIAFSADTIIHPTSFMAGCSAFNQDLTIPHFDQSVGSYSSVMYNCKAMTSKLYISEAPSSMTASNGCLGTNDSTAACYTTGIQLVGDYANDWKTKLPDRTSSPYRKLIVAS